MQKNFTKEEERQVCALFIALHLLLQHTSDEYRHDKGADRTTYKEETCEEVGGSQRD